MGAGLDVDDVERLALVGQVVYGPLEGALAALGEVHRHADLPVAGHRSRSAPSSSSFTD